ncbi:hypothetical protein BKA61DRAFT_681150 [Leptodontidium sp. MPI-SDFR-AT-0119]|nr:hypothetical protein BKA61DRAFT_681150 [Leptodontidium sp. MPI-SDFR-AT-0119]
MNSPNPILAPLTPAEEAEIAEYERIVALAEQLPIPTTAHQASSSSPAVPVGSATTSSRIPTVLPAHSPVVDYRRDYHKILGIQEHVKQDSILRAFTGKSNEHSPDSIVGGAKLGSGKPNLVKKTGMELKRIKGAQAILSDPEFREEYDAGRIRDRTPLNDRPSVRPAGRGCGPRDGRAHGGRGGQRG